MERIENWVQQARKVHPLIRMVPVRKIPFEVTPTPQLITYDLDGKPVAYDRGNQQVEKALQRVVRREF